MQLLPGTLFEVIDQIPRYTMESYLLKKVHDPYPQDSCFDRGPLRDTHLPRRPLWKRHLSLSLTCPPPDPPLYQRHQLDQSPWEKLMDKQVPYGALFSGHGAPFCLWHRGRYMDFGVFLFPLCDAPHHQRPTRP